jgi:hypothetical protein
MIGTARAKTPARRIGAMSDKVIVTGINVITEPDPWEVGMVTERLPAQELFDDGIEPEDTIEGERAA